MSDRSDYYSGSSEAGKVSRQDGGAGVRSVAAGDARAALRGSGSPAPWLPSSAENASRRPIKGLPRRASDETRPAPVTPKSAQRSAQDLSGRIAALSLQVAEVERLAGRVKGVATAAMAAAAAGGSSNVGASIESVADKERDEGSLGTAETTEQSGTSLSSPATPPQGSELGGLPISAAGSKGEEEEQAPGAFRFKDLPASLRTVGPLDPLDAARFLLPPSSAALRSTHWSSVLARYGAQQEGQAAMRGPGRRGERAVPRVSMHVESLPSDPRARAALGLAEVDDCDDDSHRGHDGDGDEDEDDDDERDVPYPEMVPVHGALSESEDEDDHDHDHGDDADFDADVDWPEQSGGNKKKRKSTRTTANEERGSGWNSVGGGGGGGGGGDGDGSGRRGDHGQEDHDGQEDKDEGDVPMRFLRSRPRIPLSARPTAQLRQKARARSRAWRATRARRRMQEEEQLAQAAAAGTGAGAKGKGGKDASAANEESKKPQKRVTKAERRAAALRNQGGAAKPTLAELRARLGKGPAAGPKPGAASAKAVEAPAPKSPDIDEAPNPAPDAPKRSPSPIPSSSALPQSQVVAPSGSFEFRCASPIAKRLQAMRQEVEQLQSRLSDQLRPIDDAVAAAADALAKIEAGDQDAAASARVAIEVAKASLPHAEMNRTKALLDDAGFQQATGAAPRAPTSPNQVAASPTQGRTKGIGGTIASPSAASVAAPPTPPPAPPQQSPQKLSRRRKAIMGNVHHRSNYVPSRVPPSASHAATSASGAAGATSSSSGLQDIPAGLDHPTTTSALFPDEWLCLFCEYKLIYGEWPKMLTAVRERRRRERRARRAKEKVEQRLAEGSGGGHWSGHHQHHQHHHHHSTQERAGNMAGPSSSKMASHHDEQPSSGSGSRSATSSHGRTTHTSRCSCGKPLAPEPQRVYEF